MTNKKLTRQAAGPVDKRKRPRGLTQAIRIAIDAIVYDRCTRADACQKAGISERALYLALEKSEVAAHWNRSIQVLRSGERARNLHRLTELRDQDDSRSAAVKAVQVLEQLDSSDAPHRGVATQPGFVILIREPPSVTVAAPPLVIDALPAAPELKGGMPLRQGGNGGRS
jgi:hypothetical protein